MNPPLVPSSSFPTWVAATGGQRPGGAEGARGMAPNFQSVTLAVGATLQDMDTGDVWYYDGTTLQPCVTVASRTLAEIGALRREMADALALANDTLDAMRNLMAAFYQVADREDGQAFTG